jgi:hypothetical protein
MKKKSLIKAFFITQDIEKYKSSFSPSFQTLPVLCREKDVDIERTERAIPRRYWRLIYNCLRLFP